MKKNYWRQNLEKNTEYIRRKQGCGYRKLEKVMKRNKYLRRGSELCDISQLAFGSYNNV
jgi:hypothetical protein